MLVQEEELCVRCEQLRRCVLLVVSHNIHICMACLADAMIAFAGKPEEAPTPEQLGAFRQFLTNRGKNE